MNFLYFVIAIVLVISIHESAHAWVANYLGDPTAKNRGRISLNPLRHLDIIGTLMLLIIGIGWGKPVPVDMRNFRNPIRGSALTALAGPTSNFITAIILAVPLKYFGDSMPDSVYSLTMAVFDLSILLGVFNLLPIPPLDGSKVLGLILPERWHRGYMGYLTQGTMFFVVFLVIDMFLIRKWFGVSVLGMTIGTLYSFVRSVILLGT